MEETRTYTFREICSKIGSGATPTGGKEAYKGGDTALVRSQNVLDFCLTVDGLAYINDAQAQKLNNVTVEENDVLLNITGDSVARACLAPNWIIPARVNQHVAIIRGKQDVVLNRYLMYYLQFKKPELLSLSQGGATRNALTKKMIEDIEVVLPTLSNQERITSLLSSLDAKIELNRRINDNLEEQAQALFRSWFVDFEPWRGVMPESWEYVRVGDIPCTIETGKRPKGGVANITDGVPSIGAESIKGIGYYDFSKTKYITYEFATTLKKGKIKDYDLLIYKDGGKPGYFIPDFSMMGEGFPYEEMYLNEHVFRLDFGDKRKNIFAYFFFDTEEVRNYLNSVGGKAAIPGINQRNVEEIVMISPSTSEVLMFGDIVYPIFKTILQNCKESARLANLRDTLLPKLMSGD